MTLLVADVGVIETRGDLSSADVTGVEHDSRQVRPGDLFCCLPGGQADGHDHVPEAVARGAVGLLCERLVATDSKVPQARVAPGKARTSMARVAARLHGYPASALTMVGVTGTNGKTTVTHLLAGVLERAGIGATVLGTLGGVRTTPEADELQRTLARVRDRQEREGRRRAVVMEVSSHALVQSRVDAIRYDVAVFTNLSHDHLDFHGSMESYWEAKASLFTPERAMRAVVSVDDEWGRRLARQATVPVTTVRRGDLGTLHLEPNRTVFTWRGLPVALPLTGSLNASNALLAAETAVALGVAPAIVVEGLATAAPVAGRLEIVAGTGGDDWPFMVMVDYAHTPAALAAVLAEARLLASEHAPLGRVLVVFGCGGQRDRAKRPEMGAVARRLADVAVVTADNPRDENPETIVAEVMAGARSAAGPAGLEVVPDRRQAIARALGEARPGDIVVVAGKGHETYQEVAGQRIPFDDRAVVAELLQARRGG